MCPEGVHHRRIWNPQKTQQPLDNNLTANLKGAERNAQLTKGISAHLLNFVNTQFFRCRDAELI